MKVSRRRPDFDPCRSFVGRSGPCESIDRSKQRLLCRFVTPKLRLEFAEVRARGFELSSLDQPDYAIELGKKIRVSDDQTAQSFFVLRVELPDRRVVERFFLLEMSRERLAQVGARDAALLLDEPRMRLREDQTQPVMFGPDLIDRSLISRFRHSLSGVPIFFVSSFPCISNLGYVLSPAFEGQVSPELELSMRSLEIFDSLRPEQAKALRAHVLERQIERGRAIYFAGDSADHFWWVIRGAVRLYKSSQDGNITTIEVLGPGEVFGAVSALDGDAYPVSAEGVSDGVAWSLPRSHFVNLLNSDPAIARSILEIITRRLHNAQERVRSFAQDAAPRRLAQALLRVTRDGEADVTRRDLAEDAGTTVETAIRVLRKFQSEGILQSSVGHIEICDAAALERLAGELRIESSQTEEGLSVEQTKAKR
jgi:CRP-like cAMP-binding protein